MTGKVIDSNATNILILILPIAFLIVLLFQAWPALLALLIFSICFQVWQQYQWKQWSQEVNPHFNQLIKENQGCLTALDLTVKANISAGAAKRYLDKRAEEFGAQRQVYEDKGTVYYFLTANALGSMFDESEPTVESESKPTTESESKPTTELESESTTELESESTTESESEPTPELESEPLSTSTPTLMELLSQKMSSSSHSESSTREIVKSPEPLVEQEPQPSKTSPPTDKVERHLEPVQDSKLEQTKLPSEKEDLLTNPPDNKQQASQSLIQAELAKRLDVHSSTVGKRKSDPDFAEWSQSRDPEGIAWKYFAKTKEFLPLEKKP